MKKLIALILLVTGLALQAQAKEPNIILILVDDQGWNGLSVRMHPDIPGSGSTYYRTPNLEKLAKEGMRFSQAYSTAPTCSPSRHSIQFGRSPASLKIWEADKIGNSYDAKAEDSLANIIKKHKPEYTTGHFGKWHIQRSPKELGYDVHDGNNGNSTGNSKDPQDPKLIFDLSKKANEFMEDQVRDGKPFFLQISHYANHLKYQARKKTVEKYKTTYAKNATLYQKAPLYGAMTEDLDEGIGSMLEKLEELGIKENTYVFYTADNGFEDKKDVGRPVSERKFYKAYPQRSHKYHVSEGGIRVPFIVRGPSITAGSHSKIPVVGTDIYSTTMEILGIQSKIPEDVEGARLLAHLQSSGKKAIERKDPFLVFKYSKPRKPHDMCLVKGNMKLMRDADTKENFLFDLEKDISESKNLATQKPELTKKMYKEMTDYFKRFDWDETQIDKKDFLNREGKKAKKIK